MDFYVKEGWELTEHAEKIARACERNGGYCPCASNKLEGEDKKCPCKDYRENNICHCNMYRKKMLFKIPVDDIETTGKEALKEVLAKYNEDVKYTDDLTRDDRTREK